MRWNQSQKQQIIIVTAYCVIYRLLIFIKNIQICHNHDMFRSDDNLYNTFYIKCLYIGWQMYLYR
jgi:hypothetical protein